MAKLFALKNDLPVLAVLPLSKTKTDWELGAIKPPAVTYDADTYAATNLRSPFDLTAVQTLLIQLMEIALRELGTRVANWAKRDDEVCRLFSNDPSLNHRQRTVLGRAVRSPDVEFRIRYHQKYHNIHYTTARRDLMQLQAKGYLLMDHQDRAFVFRRGPAIDQLNKDQRK